MYVENARTPPRKLLKNCRKTSEPLEETLKETMGKCWGKPRRNPRGPWEELGGNLRKFAEIS